jgi:hypothetical protein
MDRLVNRQDIWGRHLPLNQRTGDIVSTSARGLLTKTTVAQHYRGQDPGHLIGLHAISGQQTSLWFVIGVNRGGPDAPNSAEDTRFAALRWNHQLMELGFFALLENHDGDGGYHLWVLLDRPAPAEQVVAFTERLVSDYRWGLAAKPELYPNQPRADLARAGNWISLPGRHPTRDHWSKVWGGSDWLSGADAADIFLRLPPSPVELLRSVDSSALESAARMQTQLPPLLSRSALKSADVAAAPSRVTVSRPGLSVSRELRASMLATGMTLEALAAASGIELASLSGFADGPGDLRLSEADRLAAYLGLELRRRIEGNSDGASHGDG